MKMVNKLWITFLTLTFCSLLFAKNLTPVGRWVQISDTTGQPHSIIRIYSHDGMLFGKITQAFPQKGEPFKKYCDLCRGKQQNAPIVGLTIMKNFVRITEHTWGNGTILDPTNGKIYKCHLTLKNHGKELKVRGYIGVPLFGRTQVWLRQ